MHVVVVHFIVKPGREEVFARRLQIQAADSMRAEPGCRQFDVCRDAGPPAKSEGLDLK